MTINSKEKGKRFERELAKRSGPKVTKKHGARINIAVIPATHPTWSGCPEYTSKPNIKNA